MKYNKFTCSALRPFDSRKYLIILRSCKVMRSFYLSPNNDNLEMFVGCMRENKKLNGEHYWISWNAGGMCMKAQKMKNDESEANHKMKKNYYGKEWQDRGRQTMDNNRYYLRKVKLFFFFFLSYTSCRLQFTTIHKDSWIE